MRPYFIKLKALANKEWWILHLHTDLSLSIKHSCDRTTKDSSSYPVRDSSTNIQCVKCHKILDAPISKNGGKVFDYFQYQINHSELYAQLNKQSIREKIKNMSDPLILEKSKVEVEGINYTYIKFLAGFSIIGHFNKKNVEQISTVFINESENNLLEISESKKCFCCKKFTSGTSLKGFLMLSAKLKPHEKINA